MTDSIIAIRLTRNLRYKLTYLKIFEKKESSLPIPLKRPSSMVVTDPSGSGM